MPLKQAKLFKNLISAGVRIAIASSTRSDSVAVPISNISNKIFKGLISDANSLKEALTDIVPSVEEFKTEFKTYTVSNNAIGRYYLRSLEMAAKGVEKEPYFVPLDDKETINLEHVLPKNPEENWDQFTEEEVEIYSKRLGNLALLKSKSNDALKNKKFEEKKKEYENCPYYLTTMISKYPQWTTKEIESRQETMANYALKAWPW